MFRTTDDSAEVEFVDVWSGFTLPLDIIVNDEHLWLTDLRPLRFIKLDFEGNHLYTWNVPRELPDGYLEVNTFSVDSNGNLYGGDNQYGRTQKLVPKPDCRSGTDQRPRRGLLDKTRTGFRRGIRSLILAVVTYS